MLLLYKMMINKDDMAYIKVHRIFKQVVNVLRVYIVLKLVLEQNSCHYQNIIHHVPLVHTQGHTYLCATQARPHTRFSRILRLDMQLKLQTKIALHVLLNIQIKNHFLIFV